MQQHEPSNCCIEALSVVVEGLHWGFRECLLDYVIFVAFQNNCKCCNSFWMHVVALCRSDMHIEGTEVPFTFCRWSWDTVYRLRLATSDGIIIATIYKPSHRVKNWWVMGQHLVTHDPCDPSDFRDPFDPWPMTHRPIPCSGLNSLQCNRDAESCAVAWCRMDRRSRQVLTSDSSTPRASVVLPLTPSPSTTRPSTRVKRATNTASPAPGPRSSSKVSLSAARLYRPWPPPCCWLAPPDRLLCSLGQRRPVWLAIVSATTSMVCDVWAVPTNACCRAGTQTSVRINAVSMCDVSVSHPGGCLATAVTWQPPL